ncbi:uncharacterized protein J8A68_002430 [[Candida] subhashii]|uniref:Maintenance of telomere capping protein 1 n=1 Tax=[Candida] subhashii TaxID=561895 RepID=A0A8J5UQC2_9ASCO|nr:uncharacterized protein J8A68_002430 [[Candida] subhashii]KAG7664052.1 hypothetical protein J8A68_002430 [[Candida] subhashii]
MTLNLPHAKITSIESTTRKSMSNNQPSKDDVLDFINSLPDSKPSTPKLPIGKKSSDFDNTSISSSGTTKKEENPEDLLDFLDELAQHEKKRPTKRLEPKKTDTISATPPHPQAPADATPSATDVVGSTDATTGPSSSDTSKSDDGHTTNDAGAELEIGDPISSITNWWSTQGSNKVSSLWGSITTNAEKITEQTYQLASTTTNRINQERQQIDTADISNKLNSMILNVGQSIKQGILEELGDVNEVLNIFVVCDLYNLSYLDRIVNEKFSQVMKQVEGGVRVAVHQFNSHSTSQEPSNTTLNLFYGKLIDGEKLCFANLESSIKDYRRLQAANAPKQDNEAQQPAEEDEELVNTSNIFISIQPICTKSDSSKSTTTDSTTVIEGTNPDSFSFTIIFKDITNDISIITKSQAFPLRWASWLDGDDLSIMGEEPEGEVDPREWVSGWIKDGLALSLGVVAQEYVIKRMGI